MQTRNGSSYLHHRLLNNTYKTYHILKSISTCVNKKIIKHSYIIFYPRIPTTFFSTIYDVSIYLKKHKCV